MLNSKILYCLIVFFLIGLCHNSLAQIVDSSKLEYLHPKSKVDESLQPYFSILIPYFSALQRLKLIVKERKQVIPLTTVPSVLNLLRRKQKWRININVSNQSIKLFDPILVKNMPDSAVLGVLGHQLSHTKDFFTHRPNYMLKVFFWHINSQIKLCPRWVKNL